MPRKPVSCIVAQCPNRGIGFEGGLPWKKLPKDMARFKSITMETRTGDGQNALIMGRKTWESIPEKFRPFSGRLSVILTSQADYEKDQDAKQVRVADSLTAAVELCQADESVDQIFVIGGERVFTEAVGSDFCTRIFLTRVAKQFECDVFFPEIPADFVPTEVGVSQSFEDIPFDFVTFSRGAFAVPSPSRQVSKQLDHEEYQYLELIKDLCLTGNEVGDRTGTGVRSKFGMTMRYSLRETFPLLTTKRVFWRGVAEELLWFVKGDTNANHLAEKKIHIWDGNGSREFLDGRGLGHREVGDLGPVYGFQWRHFGAEYKTMHDDYTGEGVDQLAEVIETLKKNPNDRRMIITAWNPAALKDMALPPCHMMAQFYVANDELSCLLYQRSCDMGLGVPFNIASYALLTCMIAQVTGLKRGEFVHVMGNTHVYSNHIEPLMQEQVDRLPRPFPILKLNPAKTEIDSFEMEDFELIGYNPHPKVKMEMAV